MEQSIDLNSILTSYSIDINSPFIDPDTFLVHLEGLGKKNAQEYPEWLKWANGTGGKFWAELGDMAEAGKCELLHDTPNGRIYMPHFHRNLLEKYYNDMDFNGDFPLPNEGSIGIPIPENQVHSLGVWSELGDYVHDPKNHSILCISYPNNIPNAFVLSEYIPRRLIETCLFKVRNYLRESGNRDYAQSKLIPQLRGKESFLREILNKILIRPQDCFLGIFEGGDFSSAFWGHFCALIREDLSKKNSNNSRDIAILQSVYIIEALNGSFKAKAVKAKEKEAAFRIMEQNFSKQPFVYTLDEIVAFTNPMGSPLLEVYSQEELSGRLEKLNSEHRNDKLPELLILKGQKGEDLYVAKNKVIFLCCKLIVEAREKAKCAISKKWQRLLKNYRTDPAMDNDSEFDETLFRYIRKLCPLLNSILEDPQFPIVCNEQDQGPEIPLSWKNLNPEKLIPYSTILDIRRKDVLEDARLFLPFWYSIPFIFSIIAFFKTLTNIKTTKNAESFDDDDEEFLDEENQETGEYEEMLTEAKEIECAMVPIHHTLDSYLEELKFRWGMLIDKQARENLVEDVNSLVRDNLRQTLRVQKHYKITRENLAELAANILNRTPSLNAVNSQDSLRIYIELYLVKLLETFKINFPINEAPRTSGS